MRKKILSLLLAGILMSQIFTGIVPVNAEELEVQAEMEIEAEKVQEQKETFLGAESTQESGQNIIKTENLAEFRNAVLEQQKELEVLTENESNTGVSNTTDMATISLDQEAVTEQELSFETRTLIVFAEEEVDTKGAVSVIKDSGSLSALIYETEEETKAAYEYFKRLEGNGIEFVTVDAVTQVADTDEVVNPGEASGIPSGWFRNEANALSTSASTPTKGHHFETKKHAPANNTLRTHEIWTDIDNKACGCGGHTDAERWIYGHDCNDKNSWAFTIYTHVHTNGSSYQWTEIIEYLSDGRVTIVFSSTDVSAAEADRKNYLKGDGKTTSCFGYQVEVANTYTMAYDANGGTGTIKSGTATYGDKYTISSATTFSRTGYTFNGYYIKRTSDGKIWGGSTNEWVKESSANESKYKIYGRGKEVTVGSALVSDDTSLTTDTFTFVAMWEKNTYTIAYNKNASAATGSMSSISVKYGAKFKIAENKFTRTGHTFKGYYVKRDSDAKWYCGSTNKWQSAADIKDNSYTKTLFTDTDKERTMNTTWIRSDQGADTFTFYAVWEANSYTVTYNANGNVKGTIKGTTDSTTTAEVTYGKAISLSKKAVPKDSYYTFVGWSTSKSGEPLSSLKMWTKKVTLYAVYFPPVSDIKEVYLFLQDKTNKKKTARYDLTKAGNVSSPKGYKYELSKIKYTSLLSGTAAKNILKAIVAVDHAGNVTMVPLGNPPELEYFTQTVVHKFQNLDTNEYEEQAKSEEKVLKGNTYTPQALSPLPAGYEGYKFNSTKSTEYNLKKNTGTDIGKEYTVTVDKTTYVCYDAISYTLTLDPNGGAIDDEDWMIDDKGMTSKTVYTGKPYGYLPGGKLAEFPTVTKEGYSFTGWYTSKSGGRRVYPATIYELTANSTIYARWEVNSYKVTYDYWTNGGTAAWKTAGQTSYTAEAAYGTAVDLDVTAEKDGWTFVGWNTFPDATTGLKPEEAPIMGTEDMTLYAIYKKDITVTYIDRNDAGIQTRSERKTIYNREEGIHVILPEQNVWKEQKAGTSWEAEGWCPVENKAGELPDAETPATAMAETSVFLKNDTSFYGRYSKNVTVSYDTNGSPEELPEETKTRYYNASGVYLNPLFTLADAPTLPQNSFVCWMASDTIESGAEPMAEYAAGQTTEFTEDTLLTAKWDAYPKIEAYDRYFTLEQVKSGEITPTVLLEKVKGTDKEDGALTNGRDVVVIHYRSEDFSGFTTDGSVSVTYRATDSFGNAVTKTVMVYISDMTPQEIQMKKYVRFISTRFYKEQESYVSAEQGGLENASVWKKNPTYKAVLERTLNNKKINETVIDSDFLGQEQGVVKPGSGTWEHETQTWVFSKEEVQEVKEFLGENGLGNYLNSDGIGKFFRQFSGNRE